MADAVKHQPLHLDNKTAHLFARRQIREVARARLPKIAGQRKAGNQLKRDLGPKDRHPIGLELRRKRVQAGTPAVNLLVNAHDQIKYVQQHQANPHPTQINYGYLSSSSAGCCVSRRAHIFLLR